jgi:SmpA/OmlA family protein
MNAPMTKREFQMMKQTKNRGSLNRYSITLDFRSNDSTWSEAIRHLSFAICKLCVVLLLGIAMVSCAGKRINKANVDEVAEGMSKKQVESILGPPTELDNKDFVILKKTTYVYRQGKDTVTIVFKDDKVVEKQSTLTD